MRRMNVMYAAMVGGALYGVMALAADPGLNLDTKILSQKVKAQVSLANPTVVAVKAEGPINANIRLQSHSASCVALVEEIAPGVCVPNGPGGPVSPN